MRLPALVLVSTLCALGVAIGALFPGTLGVVQPSFGCLFHGGTAQSIGVGLGPHESLGVECNDGDGYKIFVL